MVGQHEVAKVIDPEMDFEPVLRDTPSGPYACVVDQDIEGSSARLESAGGCPGRVQRGQVESQILGRAARRLDFVHDRKDPLLRPAGCHDVKPVGGQSPSGGPSNA